MPVTCAVDVISAKHENDPVIGIVLGNAFDEWLDELGISLETFANNMMGSWVFNYVQALQAVGVRSVLFCVSTRVRTRTRLTHAPTKSTIILLPPPTIYQLLRRWWPKQRMTVPDRQSITGINRLTTKLRQMAEFVVSGYLATPLVALFREIRHESCRSLLVQEYESVRFDLCSCMGYLEHIPVFAAFTGGLSTKSLGRPLRSLALDLCSGLLIPSRSESERVRQEYRFPAEKVSISYPPIDSSTFYPTEKAEARAAIGIPVTARVAMYHGAISLQYKGLDVLMRAWEQICERQGDRDLRLVLLGTGVDASKLSQLVDEKQLGGIEWVNRWIQDRSVIRRYLSAADVYVFPSRGDACPNAVIEAMACGLPVVASNVNGIPDILEGGERSGGCIVQAGDSQGLAQALERILKDDLLAVELGRRAMRRVEEAFTMPGIGKPLKSFLLEQQP